MQKDQSCWFLGGSHMNELKVINLDNTDISTWDFPSLKTELQAYLSEYEGLVYTDETIKDAKKDRATLKKAKDVIEDAKKAYRNRCLEPYDRILPQITELVDLIEGRRKQIDETVKAYENMKREAKEKDVREYYDRISESLGPYAERIYEKVFDPKWTNATTSTGKYREAIQNVVASVTRDMAKIIELTSPFEETLKEAYLDTLSMDAVLQKKEELETASSKAGFIGGVESGSESLTAQVIVSSEKAAADETEGTLVRIHASQARLDQILDFMKAIGVFYEII